MIKYTWVQIFENKGAAMGCSNPHPHCQIWSSSFLPNEPSIKDQHLLAYHQKYGRPLLDDYVDRELQRKERIVIENPDWLVVVPYWAAWPFETLLISRNKNKRISDLTTVQTENLAKVIKELTTKYDNLFNCSFPYSMGWHGKPLECTLTSTDTYTIPFVLPSSRCPNRPIDWEWHLTLDFACPLLSAVIAIRYNSQVYGRIWADVPNAAWFNGRTGGWSPSANGWIEAFQSEIIDVIECNISPLLFNFYISYLFVQLLSLHLRQSICFFTIILIINNKYYCSKNLCIFK